MTAKERIRQAAGAISGQSGSGETPTPARSSSGTAKERIAQAAQQVRNHTFQPRKSKSEEIFKPLMAQKAEESPTMALAVDRAFHPKASQVILKQSEKVNEQVKAAEAEVQRDTLKRDLASGGYAAALGGTKKPVEHPVASSYAAARDALKTPEQKETAEKKATLGRLMDQQNELAKAYYFAENEEQRERISRDGAMLDKQKRIGDLQDTIRMALAVAADAQNPGSGGEPYQIIQAKERLAREYGITQEAIRNYALYGDDDSVPAEGGYTNISQFIHVLEREQQQLADDMKDAGYDYNRMRGYQQWRKDEAEAKVRAEERRKAAKENPGLASLGTVIAGPLQALDFGAAVLSSIGSSDPSDPKSYVPINPATMDTANAVSTVRGEVAKMAEEKWGGVGSFAYQTGMSMADFLFTSGITGNFSGGGKLAANLSLGIMGSNAAAGTTVDALNRGLSNRQALTLGAIAGVAEIVTEKVSLETLLDKTALDKSRLGYFLKNVIAEGSEEATSDVINWVADIMVSRDKSEWRQAIAAYQAQGMNENEAFFAALTDQAKSIGLDALGGAVSGGVMAGGRVAMDMHQDRVTGRDIRQSMKSVDGVYQAVIDTGLESGADTDAYHLAEKNQRRLDKKGELSDGQLGRQYRANMAAIEAEESVDTIAEQNPVEDVKNVPTGSEAVAARLDMMREHAKIGFGPSGEAALLDVYDKRMAAEIDPAEAYGVFSRAYTAAMMGQEAAGVDGAPKMLVEAAQIAAKYDLRAAQGTQLKVEATANTPGFYYDDAATRQFVATLPTEVEERMDTVARDLGLTIRAVDSVFGGQANAQITGSEILIDKNVTTDGVSYILGHEFTHRIQELAGTEYAAFQSALDLGKLRDAAARIAAIYQDRGIKITEAQAMDEATADMAGEMLQNGKVLDEFIASNRGNKTLLQRVREVFRAIIEKLSGGERRRAQIAEEKLTAALKAAAQNAKVGKDADVETADAGARFSIGYDVNNTPFVTVEDDILDGVPRAKWTQVVSENLKEKFPDGVKVGKNLIKINSQSRREMTYSEYTKWLRDNDISTYADKFRATDNADEIIRATQGYINEGLKHERKDNIKDFARGTVLLRIGGADYSAEVIVGTTSSGEMLLYDIVNMKETQITEKDDRTIQPNLTESRRSGAIASNENVSQDGGDVKPSHSLKGTEHAGKIAELERENAALQAKYERAVKQTRRSDAGKVSEAHVNRYAKMMMDHIGAKGDAKAMGLKLQTMYDAVASGHDLDGAEFTFKDFRRMANDIAGELVSKAVKQNDTLYEDYADLRGYIRSHSIVVDAETRADITDYDDFRKRNMGRLRLAHGETGNIDTVYTELAREWPGLFPEDLTHGQDQLERIAEVMATIYERPQFNPWEGDIARATQTFANEIMEEFWQLPGQEPTYADRQWRQREELKRRHMAEIRDAVQAEREKGKIQEKKLKEQFQRKRQEAVDISKRETINRMADRMTKRLLHPTSKQHVPEQLRGPALEVLASLNRESGYELVFGKDAKYKRVLRGEVLDSEPTARTEKMRALRDAIDKLRKDDSYMGVIDPDMMENIKEIEEMKDIPLVNMTSGQLTTVGKVLCALERAVTSADKAMSQAKYTKISQWAENLRIDTKTKRERSHFQKGFLSLDMATPYTFFARYGEAGKEIFRAMQAAEGKSKVLAREVGEQTGKIVDAKTVRELQATRHDIELESGEHIVLTTAHIMELYELVKRQQAHDHILEGGVYQPEIDGLPVGKEKKIYRGTEPLKLTPNDLRNITQKLSGNEIKIADRLQGLMTGMLAEYGNQASMEVYGYRKFTEPDYWPIHVAKEGTYYTTEKNAATGASSTRNMGMTKATIKHANNPLELHGAFQTFAQHTSDMIEYSVGLTVMEDMERLVNFTYEDTGKNVKNLLDKVGGSGSQEYWARLMEDFQNGIKERSDTEVYPRLGRAVGNFKATRVAANLQVIIQQPTAWVKAMFVLNPKHMAMGISMGATPGKAVEKMLKYSPIAVQKDLGGIDMGSRASMKEILFDDKTQLKRVNDFLGAGAQLADTITWGRLWNACEWAVADREGSPAKGSDAFYQAVNDLFNDVICQTQVVDGIMQRSQIMRSGNAVIQQGSAFMGEPVQAYNIMMRAYENWRYEQDASKRGNARRKFGRAAFAVIATNVVTALAKSLTGAMRDDDPDKKYWERYLAKLTGLDGDEETTMEKVKAVLLDGNLADQLNPIGWMPFAKDLLSIFEGYDVSRTELETVSDFFKSAQRAIKAIGGDGKDSIPGALANLFASGANFFGVPVENIKRDVTGVLRSFAGETDNLALQYELDKAMYNMANTSNKKRFISTLCKAIMAGDKELEERIIGDLNKQAGMDAEAIDIAVKKQMKEKLWEGEVPQKEKENVDIMMDRAAIEKVVLDLEKSKKTLEGATEHYERAMERLTGSPLAKKATEQQLKNAKVDAYKFATRSGGELDQKRWDSWEAAGMDAGTYALYQLAEEMADQPNEKGKLGTITNEEREAAIRSLGMSKRDNAALWVLAGGSEKSNPWR